MPLLSLSILEYARHLIFYNRSPVIIITQSAFILLNVYFHPTSHLQMSIIYFFKRYTFILDFSILSALLSLKKEVTS